MLSFYQVQNVTQREKLKGKMWVTIFHLHGAKRNSRLGRDHAYQRRGASSPYLVFVYKAHQRGVHFLLQDLVSSLDPLVPHSPNFKCELSLRV